MATLTKIRRILRESGDDSGCGDLCLALDSPAFGETWANSPESMEILKKERDRLLSIGRYEDDALCSGYSPVAGADEAGRAPLAGPLSVAVAVFDRNPMIPGINDSKLLTPENREEIFDQITKSCLDYKVNLIDADRLNRTNMHRATLDGIWEAFQSLKIKPGLLLIDGLFDIPGIGCASRAIVKGDGKCYSIAAASILAKVARDRVMIEMDKLYPQYGFAQHKGYPTRRHLEALEKYGPCPIHRKNFAPVVKAMRGRLEGLRFKV